MEKGKLPHRFELVICKIIRINPHSAIAEIGEYHTTGLIHASEVAKKWVRDIRDFLKEGQYIVCRVMDIDRQTLNISLSAKRVSREESTRKLNEFNREKRAEKLLELVAKDLGKTLEEAHSEVGYEMMEQFGPLSKAFEIAVKNEELFRSKGLPKKWVDKLVEIAKKNYEEKEHEIKVELKLVSYNPSGIDVIKSAISNNSGKFELKYISAPTYLLIGKGKNYKDLKAKISSAAESIVKEVNKSSGDASYSLVEK